MSILFKDKEGTDRSIPENDNKNNSKNNSSNRNIKSTQFKVAFITQAAVIAALYVVLVIMFNYCSFGPIQFRIAEALTILPYFTPAAIPGLFVGCLLSNILGGAAIWDIIFGSIATLIGAIGTYALRKNKWLAYWHYEDGDSLYKSIISTPEFKQAINGFRSIQIRYPKTSGKITAKTQQWIVVYPDGSEYHFLFDGYNYRKMPLWND